MKGWEEWRRGRKERQRTENEGEEEGSRKDWRRGQREREAGASEEEERKC